MSNVLKCLFQEAVEDCVVLKITQVVRSSELLLAIPNNRNAALETINLYTPQKKRAQILHQLLRGLYLFKLPIPLQKRNFHISTKDKFFKFLISSSNVCEKDFEFGFLAGNPKASGRKFIVLVFSANGTPQHLVKVGVGNEAIELINREIFILEKMRQKFSKLPRLCSTFRSENKRAFSVEYIKGRSPNKKEYNKVPKILMDWILPKNKIILKEINLWKKLSESNAGSIDFDVSSLMLRMEDKEICECLFHGDFAPWNIKVQSDGQWKVIDWERGEYPGLPSWDWFHYIVQTEVLVKNNTAPNIVKKLKETIQSKSFKDYMKKANADDIKFELLQLYFVYVILILKPSEGLDSICRIADFLFKENHYDF